MALLSFDIDVFKGVRKHTKRFLKKKIKIEIKLQLVLEELENISQFFMKDQLLIYTCVDVCDGRIMFLLCYIDGK